MHPEGHYMYIHILLYKDALLSIKAYFLKTWILPLLISYVKSVKKKSPVYIDWTNENFTLSAHWSV